MMKIRLRNRLKYSIGLTVFCYSMYGCQSPLWEFLKQPVHQKQAQLLEENRIQQLFADAGFAVYPPARQEKSPRYRCQTRYFEITFAATDAAVALDLTMQADATYEAMKRWFQFSLPSRVKVRIEPAGSVHSEPSLRSRMTFLMQHTDGRTTGASAFYLNSAANPNRHTFAHELGHLFFLRMTKAKPVPW